MTTQNGYLICNIVNIDRLSMKLYITIKCLFPPESRNGVSVMGNPTTFPRWDPRLKQDHPGNKPDIAAPQIIRERLVYILENFQC